MNNVIIKTQGLSKTYGFGAKKVEAVRGLDLEVRRGEIFGLVGPDGAGKTTTMQMLCGILTATSGQATVAGVDVLKNPDGLGGRIGYMSEGFTLYGSLSVRENLDFFADLYKVPDDQREKRISDLLRFTRLEKAGERRAENLSGGMKKKLALACAITYSPQVLFLDEPTTGVDPVSRRDFWLLLNDFLEQGITVFVSTPYMDEAERFHRVAFMHQGQIIASDTPTALRSSLNGEMLDLLAKPQADAVKSLRLHPRASHVQVFGERLHLLVENQKQDLPVLTSDLSNQNIHISDVRHTTPSLEDVFVALLEKQTVDRRPLTMDIQTSSVHCPLSDIAVSVSGLTKTFGDFTAVNNISFRVKEGEIFGFLGPNGSGKTTTIRMLCGLLAPTSGKGMVAGRDILTQQSAIKSEIGYMSQKFSLYNDLTVEENLDFYAGVYGLTNSHLTSRKHWALEMAGLTGRERAMTRDLSGGWKQRLALGCSILHEPSILFLDEPTSGVDPISRRAFWDLIFGLSSRGVTVFVTTHYMDEAEHCNTLGLIYNGRMIAQGSPADLRSNMQIGQMLEIVSPQPLRTLRDVREMDGVLSAGLFGDRVHVLVEDAKRLTRDIQSALASNGLSPRSIAPIPFSLEDLFVTLIEMEESRTNSNQLSVNSDQSPTTVH
ncbi:MAG: ATP-binding cassette domain-containing protein [Anaerolineales bacterium]|nr:ATP-binding cassette domain-containing protein [Anaerolineales bacterium]